MKQMILGLIVIVTLTGFSRVISPSSDDVELPTCAAGTQLSEDSAIESGCILSPSDCSRGIDEANQEECAK